MKHKILIIIGIIIIGLAGLIMFLTPAASYSKDENKIVDPETVFNDVKMNFDDLKTAYHESINKIFNEGFSRITAGNANTKPPPETDKEDKECSADKDPLNVSTFCIAVRTTKVYMKYAGMLDVLKNQVFEVKELEEGKQPVYTQKGLLDKIYYRTNVIDKEIKDAKRALDITLGAYKEFQYSYPLHKAYAKTFDLLVKYRDWLAEIRSQVELFPMKFINATTSKCE